MEKVRFSLAVLLEVMREGRITTVMRTKVEGISDLRGVCAVELRFESGVVNGCLLSNEHSGFYGPDAYKVFVDIIGEKELHWFTQAPESSPAGELPKGNFLRDNRSRFVPVRSHLPKEQEFSSWSRIQRQVYNLIDGKRNVEKIAAILSQKQEVVATALDILSAANVIVFRPAPPSTQEVMERQFVSLFQR